jgi:hypothetical protein
VTRPVEDTLVRHARREAAVALLMWLVAMIYSVGVCYTYGYGREPDSLTFVLWFPDWVFWGIVVPWAICTLASVGFAFAFMGDEGLGAEVDADPRTTSDSPSGHAEVRHG